MHVVYVVDTLRAYIILYWTTEKPDVDFVFEALQFQELSRKLLGYLVVGGCMLL